MMAEIEANILAGLKTAGFGIVDTEPRGGGQAVNYPAVFVFTEAGTFSRVSQKSHHCALTVYLVVAFRHSQGETARRRGIYPIIEGLVSLLYGQRLGLDIDPLKPVRFGNITDKDMEDKSVVAYQIEFATGFDVSIKPEDGPELLRVGLSYLTAEGREMAEDDVNLSV